MQLTHLTLLTTAALAKLASANPLANAEGPVVPYHVATTQTSVALSSTTVNGTTVVSTTATNLTSSHHSEGTHRSHETHHYTRHNTHESGMAKSMGSTGGVVPSPTGAKPSSTHTSTTNGTAGTNGAAGLQVPLLGSLMLVLLGL